MYETRIYNRQQAGEAFGYVTVPARSFPDAEVPHLEVLADTLALRTPSRRQVQGVEPWMLPFFIDAALGRNQDFPYWMEFEQPFRRRGPSEFAQYLAFEAVVPFESSPLSPKSLASLAAAGGTLTTAATALGVAAEDHPILLVIVPVGIVLGGPILGAGVVGFQATVHYLQRLLRLPDGTSSEDTSDEG